jgi:hypothetical protein
MSAVDGLVLGERRGRWMVAAVACAAAMAWAAAPARAVDYTIPGSPLTVYANDAGQLQVAFTGSANGEFFPGTLAPASAGVNVAESTNPPALTVYGFRGSTPLTQDTTNRPSPGLAGDGSAANPYTLTINMSDNGFLHVQEVLTYVNGTTDVGVRFTLEAFDNAVTGRLFEAADLYVAGNDQGVGSLDPGPPRQVGGVNAAAGRSARLIQGTPAWSHYQESFYDSVYALIAGSTSTSAPSLSDTINSALGNNDVGVQWDFAGVGSGTAAQTFSTTWHFSHFSALDLAATPAQVTGKTATVTVTARNADGGPDPGRTVRYAIAGANPGAGVATTGADGRAVISWTGKNVGTDNFDAFTDINQNGVREGNEPERTATVTWSVPPPPPPPVPGKSVVVKVVSGEVFIKLPGSGRGARATGPRKGFVPFTGAANIPVGSQLDTSKGRVALTSAADTGGVKTQTSDFYKGIFQVRQSVPKKKPSKPAALITDLVMKGQIARSQCAPLKGARSAAVDARKKKKGPKSVLGKLWGSGKGKFRTDGRYSSATVRGTIWLVEDRCDGTLTQVKRGVVSVRDIKRKKTVKVRAGHSYLASAVTSKSRRKKR